MVIEAEVIVIVVILAIAIVIILVAFIVSLYTSGGNGVMVEVVICIIVGFDLAGGRLY